MEICYVFDGFGIFYGDLATQKTIEVMRSLQSTSGLPAFVHNAKTVDLSTDCRFNVKNV